MTILTAAETGCVWLCLALAPQVPAASYPLIEAARSGQVDTVRTLLARGTPADDGENGPTALKIAALMGHEEIVSILLASGADPNRNEGSALAHAVLNRHTSIAKALLDHGANPNLGQTTLLIDATRSNGDPAMIRLLLDHRVDASRRDENDHTALFYAQAALKAARGLRDRAERKDAVAGAEETVRLLVAAGVREERGPAANLIDAVKSGRVKDVRTFLTPASVNAVDERGLTPVMWAARKGMADILRLLLAAGADVNTTDPTVQGTALRIAAASGRADIVKLLLEKGAAVNGGGESPLFAAVAGGSVEVVTLLLNAGADVHAKDSDGKEPVSYAALMGLGRIVERLTAAGMGLGTGSTPVRGTTRTVARKPVPPVHDAILKEFLPQIDGWERRGETNDQGYAQVSGFTKASAQYRKGDIEIDLSIIDTGYDPEMHAMFAALLMMASQGTPGGATDSTLARITIRSYPGYQEWQLVPLRYGTLNVEVAERFVVTASGIGLSDVSVLREIVEAISLAKLATVRK